MRGQTSTRAIAAVLAAVVLTAFVLLPLIGQPRLIRVGPVLLCAAILVALSARPWKWSQAEWSALGDWNPSPRAVRSAAIAIGLMLFWFVLTRFRSGEINAIDFTVYYDRPNFQTLLGRPLYIESADDPLRAYRSYFSVHAHWVMLPLAGLYFLWATPLWLLALSVIAVVMGGLYTLRILQHIGAGGLVGSASALAFVLNDNTARTLNYGFHTEVLYAWFIPWMIDAGLRRRWKSFAIAAVACIAVKEDAFLFAFAVAVTLLLLRGRTFRKIEWLVFLPVPIVAAALNLIVYFGYLVPRLSATGAPFYANYWANYGPTAMTAFLGMLRDPIRVLSSTLTSSFWTRVIVPHLYLPLIGWRWVIGIAPVVLLYGASSNEQLRSFGIYYAIVLVPFLVLGAATGALRFAGLFWSDKGKVRALAAALIVFGALIGGISDAGYSLRPWKGQITGVPRALGALSGESIVLVQSGLYPHAGYDSRIQLLTKDTLIDPRYAGAAVLLAPGVSAYPLTSTDVDELLRSPVITRTPEGLTAVRGTPAR